MAYVACKPCNFAGQAFRIGDIIPADIVQPGIAKRLIAMGRIAAADGTATETKTAEPEKTEPATIEIVIHANEGDMPLEVTKEGIQAVFDVLTDKVSAAEKTIEAMEDPDALILLHIADGRKSVKELAETRAKALNSEAEGGDQ